MLQLDIFLGSFFRLKNVIYDKYRKFQSNFSLNAKIDQKKGRVYVDCLFVWTIKIKERVVSFLRSWSLFVCEVKSIFTP